MDPQVINTAAQAASQVGLLNWIVTGVCIFCGGLIFTVMYQGYRREERLAKLQETTLTLLGQKMDGLENKFSDGFKALQDSAKYQRDEHTAMTLILSKMNESLIILTTVIQKPLLAPQGSHGHSRAT